MKKILYVPSLNIGVIKWRIEDYANQLIKHKDKVSVMVEYFFDPSENLAWDKLCKNNGDISTAIYKKLQGAFKTFDYIIFQKIQNIEGLELIDEFRQKFPDVKCIAEIDDAIGDATPSNYYTFKEHHTIAAKHCMLMDAVVCSTEYLANSIVKIVGEDKPIHVAPNCINKDLWKYKSKKNKKDTSITNIVYCGGGGHDEDLKLIYPSMRKILEENPDVKWTVRSGAFRPDFLWHENIDFKTVSWGIDEYPQKLSDLNADIAVVPLRDTEFNRCKSNIKWMEWAYQNIPVIASNVEPYKGLEHVKLVGNDREDWYKAINEKVILSRSNSPVTKDSKGYCIKKFNIKKECDRLIDFLNKI
jgi:hypothetical protein